MNIIYTTSFEEVCHWEYTRQNYIQTMPSPGIICCRLMHIARLFKILDKAPEREYIIVSPACDTCLVHQKEYPVNRDLVHYVVTEAKNRKRLEDISGFEEYYLNYTIQSPREKDDCDIKDKYSIRTVAKTFGTFNKVPSCVKAWYSTNVNIPEDFVHELPYGIFNKTDPDLFRELASRKKYNKIYINFDINSTFRQHLMKDLKENVIWSNDIEPVFQTEKLKYEDFLAEIAGCKFVLSPPGIGLDTYRFYESLYCGSLPIIFHSDLSSRMRRHYPCLIVYDHKQLESLRPVHFDTTMNKCPDWRESLDVEYWKSLILQ